MSTFDTTRWYEHSKWKSDCRPLVSESDVNDLLPVVDRFGHYDLVDTGDLTPIPERHTVERRVPKAGERFTFDGTTMVARSGLTFDRWVIVDDEVTA